MLKLIVVFGLCTPYKIINRTDSWLNVDRDNMEIAAKRCTELYPDSCLKIFEKVDKQVYRAICK